MNQLFGSYTSPYVRHCRIAFLQEEIPFEFVETSFQESADNSPTKRVPYLRDGNRFLTDSTAILCHIRNTGGKALFRDADEANRYFTADTALDTGINIFLLEKDGLTESSYITRQKQRKIVRAAQFYLSHDSRLANRALRFDALLIEPGSDGRPDYNWIQNAFYAE